MRELLLSNGFLIVTVIAVLEAIMAVMLWKMYTAERREDVLCLACLCTGLVYDAAIIALGAVIPAGIAVPISKLRYIFSGLLIPLLVPIGVYGLKLKGLKVKIAWITAVLLMIPGVIGGVMEKLELLTFAGVTRYISTGGAPGWVSAVNRMTTVGTVFFLIVIGIILLVKKRGGYVLAAGLLMLFFSVIGPASGNTDLIFMLSMVGELFMVFFLMLHMKRE